MTVSISYQALIMKAKALALVLFANQAMAFCLGMSANSLTGTSFYQKKSNV
jgi:hypothetical protein